MPTENSETPKKPIKITPESGGDSTVQGMFDKNLPQTEVPELVMARLLRNVTNAVNGTESDPTSQATPATGDEEAKPTITKLSTFKR